MVRIRVVISCDRDCERFLDKLSGVSEVDVGNVDLAFREVRLSNSVLY